jgi:hypothetical protein
MASGIERGIGQYYVVQRRECEGEGTVKACKQSIQTENSRTRSVPVFEKDLVNEFCTSGQSVNASVEKYDIDSVVAKLTCRTLACSAK